MINPQSRHHQKPSHHDRAEQDRHPLGALALEQKQPQNDHQRQRQHEGAHRRRDKVQAFNRRQNRHCRCDHRIAEKQRNPDHPNRQQPAGALVQRALHQGHQRQCATFALVVGPHDQGHIFHRHDQNQRPDQQRNHPDHIITRQPVIAGGVQRFPHSVKRRGADIAIDDTNAAKHQFPHVLWGLMLGVRGNGSRDGSPIGGFVWWVHNLRPETLAGMLPILTRFKGPALHA